MTRLFNKSRLATLMMLAMGGTAQAATELSPAELQFTLITGEKVSAVVKPDGQLGGIRLHDENGQEQLTSVFRRGDSQYVLTAKSQNLVDNHGVDLELFNITKLHQSGYDDASTDKLPVIVEYTDGTLAGSVTPTTFEGVSLTGELEIIDSAAFAISKDKAAQVWQSFSGDSRIKGVWLDAMVQAHKTSQGSATLTPTVPLTGAYGPLAAQYTGAGVKVAVLDTGYDTSHADLVGKVIAERDFIWPFTKVDDLNGHGTHTASTIAGTGAESNGLWAGVSPGADLIVGKVLSDAGGGSTFGILNGMIWAVEEGAQVVNMSLGGSGTSCAGPLVDMVEALSDQALFVISAGNSFSRETVGVPGCAPSALTVGALDRENNTASFSSRGPSPDGHSSKPDIASQGVDVVAAASGGTGATAYKALSGTSMSAPHVAGGAAIVMQARPDLSPQEVKQILTSSAVESDAHVLEQGAGPMDINRAVAQAVISAPNQELGLFRHGDGSSYTETQVTLENLSSEEITLKLSLDLIGEDGITKLPATFAGLGEKEITIAANKTAQLPVWVNPEIALRDGAYGAITGKIIGKTVGTDDEQVIVPISFWIDQPQVTLDLNVTDRRGMPASSPSKVYLINEEDDWGRYVQLNNGHASVSVPSGDYTVVAHIMTYDNDSTTAGLVESATMMADLDAKLTTDRQLQFDARDAREVTFKASKPLATQGFSFGFTYALDDSKNAKLAAYDLAPDYVNNMYAWSQGHDSRFRSFVTTRAVAPETEVRTQGGVVLDYVNQGEALSFHGEGSAEVVAVGEGDYSTDWSQFDLEGKIALISHPYYVTSYMVRNAMNAGAIGVIHYRGGSHGRYKGNISGTPRVPVINISAEQGELLAAEVEAGNNRISWSGIAAERTPYAYSINHITDGAIESGQIVLQEQKMRKVTAQYHSQNDERPAWTDVMAMTNSTGEFYSTGSPQMIMLPIEREEYYSATTKNAWTNIVMPSSRLGSNGGYFDGPRVMTEGEEQTSWFKGPRTGALLTNGSAMVARQTNLLYFRFATFGDGAGHDGTSGFNGSSAVGVKLDGQSVFPTNGMLEVPHSNAEVELTTQYYARGVGERSPVKDNLGSFFRGVYSFNTHSETQGRQAVLMPTYDIPVDIENSVPAGEAFNIALGAKLDSAETASLSEVSVQYAFGEHCLPEGVSAFSYCPVSTLLPESAWQQAEVSMLDGQWTATLPNNGAAGEFVHLRVQMTDASGSTASQTMMRVYMLD
ncbi:MULTISPECIES: S8 family serine peptidase [unclassified Pseudoalteromonas]|uniref:S8 family serine peptidase n=1 Tax=unclassified Pseudoalteromonas TaxID=194690 RepID=UPI000CF6528E|nr:MULTISPECIES: S8 family serine peptidase [unclassified Pseudoalteromonas]